MLNANPAIAKLGDDYYEDFENISFPDLGWEATGLWHVEDNATSYWPIYDIPSDSRYAWYGSNKTGNYDTGDFDNYGFLTSDSIDLKQLYSSLEPETPIELGFWSWAETENDKEVDRKEIYISKDGGSWDLLGQIPDSDNVWQYYAFDLTPYADSQDIRIQFSFDTIDDYANAYRGWLLDDITIGAPRPRFELFIMQDYSAGVTDTRKMGFFIDSFFDIALHVDIHIFMKTPYGEEITLLYKEEILIYELDRWEEWLEFTFPEPGDYWVYFIVVDETGMEWSTNCPWEIESNFFDLHIDQEYHAGVTDVRDMIFHAKSYFNYGMIINISIDIRTPSDSKNLHSEELVEIEAFGFWDYGLEYEFPDPGEYMVTFRVVNAKTGDTWIVECPWKIETDFLGVWIDQDTHAFVGETHDIGFRIKNYYDGLIGMDIDYIAEMHTPSGMTEPLFQHTGVWISAYDEIGIMISYEFTEPGDYKVFFRATDTYGYSWTIDCYWKVEELSEKERFELKIDQNTEANVGDEGRMKFLVNSFFNHAMDVNINITIKTPSGDVETLFNEVVWIDSYGDWEKSIDYEFEEEGDYTVLLVLTDDIGVEWVEDCEWEISEPSTSEIASSEESNPPIITPTPGFGGFTIIGAIVAIATYYRKRHT